MVHLRQLAVMMRQQPLAMLARTKTAIWDLALRDRRGEAVTREQLAGGLEASDRAAPAAPAGIAVIPVTGLIMQHRSRWSDWGFATATEDLVEKVRAAVADVSVRAVVLNIESPGGYAYGVQEAADALLALREQKRIIAVANSYAASAAYWLASAASELVVTPSGDVGSIGVFAVHEDWSEAYAQAGVKPTLIKAGKFKAEFSDLAPLTDEARDELQRSVDETYDAFVKAVAKGRGVTPGEVRSGFGEGRMVSAKAAVTERMADRVGTLDDVLEKFAPRPRGHRADDAGADLELRERRTRLSSRG